jgi:hypothetical protein
MCSPRRAKSAARMEGRISIMERECPQLTMMAIAGTPGDTVQEVE